jgi:mannosyltransferase
MAAGSAARAVATGDTAVMPHRLVRSLPVATLAVLALAIAVSALLRVANLAGPFWIDEGISVGIASHAFGHIPGVLGQDGSPPLYYLLLHVWIGAFGDGVASTHALSLVFALLSIPAGFWAGWTLFGRTAGLMAAALFAVSPMLSAYAQETRMYSLLALLGLICATAFVQAFVHRRRGMLPLFILALAALLYTHNWGAFFALGCVAAVAVLIVLTRDVRRLALDGVIGFGVAALLYLPWLPTLMSQVRHTGAPWASHPSIGTLAHTSDLLLGGSQATVAVLLGAGAGLAGIASRRRLSREALSIVALLTIVVVGLLSAFAYSEVALAWAPRYLTVFLGPLLIAVAAGLARARALGLVAFALLVCISIARTPDAASTNKSNVNHVAQAFASSMRRGDIVVSTQPEQVPNLRYYLGGQFTYVTPMGRVADDRVMDWRDAVARLRAARVSRELTPLIDGLPRGRRVLLVTPITHHKGWRAPWTRLVRRRSRQWRQAIDANTRLRRVAMLDLDGKRSSLITVRATLFQRR